MLSQDQGNESLPLIHSVYVIHIPLQVLLALALWSLRVLTESALPHIIKRLAPFEKSLNRLLVKESGLLLIVKPLL